MHNAPCTWILEIMFKNGQMPAGNKLLRKRSHPFISDSRLHMMQNTTQKNKIILFFVRFQFFHGGAQEYLRLWITL